MNENLKIIGRENERAQLHHAFTSVKEGKGGMILLAGEAGVGKTLLAEECLTHSDLTVSTARATKYTPPAYGYIISLFRDCFRSNHYKTMDFGPLTPYLGLLLPELGPAPNNTDRETLIEAIITGLIELSRQLPSAFLLDDLHCADNATLEILPLLVDLIQREPLLILGTYRNDEVLQGNRIRWMRNELRKKRQLLEITLGPLSREESASLIKEVLGDTPCPGLIQKIHLHTNGLPFFVEEVSSVLISKGCLRAGTNGVELIPEKEIPLPQSVRDTVLIKLENLSEQARKKLEIAAVAGTEFNLELIIELTGEEIGLDELFDRNFIVETQQGRGCFRHALTRTAVISEIPWSKRRSLYRKVANFMEVTEAPAEAIADNWLRANEVGKARQAFIAAADKSYELYAYGDATKTLLRAIEIWPKNEDEYSRLKTLERLAFCAQLSGQLSISEQAWSGMIESPIIQKDNQHFATIQRSLATVYSLQGKSRAALKSRETSMRIFQEAGMAIEAAVEAIAAVSPLVGSLQLAEAEKKIEIALDLTEKSERKDLLIRALGLKAFILGMMGKYPQALESGQTGLSLALEHNLVEAAAAAYRRMGGVLEYASDFPGAKEAYFAALDHCQRQGAEILAHDCMGCLAYVLFRSGDWARSSSICQQIINFKDSPPLSLVKAYGTLGLVHAFKGEVKQARRLIQLSADIASRHEITMTVVLIYWGLAILDEQAKACTHAEEHYKQMMEKWCDSEDRHDAIAPLCCASTFFATNGMEYETSLCTQALSAIATETGNPEALAGFAYALGETSLLNNNSEEAIRQFLQAYEQMEKLSIPTEQALAGYRVGAALANGKRREEAIRYLDSAYRLARKLGARPLAGQIAKELEILGETAEERHNKESEERKRFRGGLSRRQMEILQLLATGLTNKEMALKLFLSPRTVEMHVANILDRLNCRTRSEAVRKAGELKLLG